MFNYLIMFYILYGNVYEKFWIIRLFIVLLYDWLDKLEVVFCIWYFGDKDNKIFFVKVYKNIFILYLKEM